MSDAKNASESKLSEQQELREPPPQRSPPKKNPKELSAKDSDKTNDKPEFFTYSEYKEVFRDVIRSVYQMKKIIEKNPANVLAKIAFKFKAGGQYVSFCDVVKQSRELTHNETGKHRFVIFKVSDIKIKPNNQKVYINAFNWDGVAITATLNYPSKDKQSPYHAKYKNKFVIAYGKISKGKDKFFLNLAHDANIRTIDSCNLLDFCTTGEFEKYIYPRKAIGTIAVNTQKSEILPLSPLRNHSVQTESQTPPSCESLPYSSSELTPAQSISPPAKLNPISLQSKKELAIESYTLRNASESAVHDAFFWHPDARQNPYKYFRISVIL